MSLTKCMSVCHGSLQPETTSATKRQKEVFIELAKKPRAHVYIPYFCMKLFKFFMKINTFLTSWLLLFSVSVSAQTFEWGRSAKASMFADARGLATDGAGNIYATGAFFGKVSFGDKVLNATGRDIYIAKFDPKGNVLWAQRAGSTNDDFATAIATDKTGNSIITGSYIGKIYIGTDSLFSTGQSHTFIAKFSSDGNLLWAKSAGGIYGSYGMSVAFDKAGNSYVGGFFKDTMFFPDGKTLVGTLSSNNLFLAKIDPKGNFLWAKALGGANYYTPTEGISLATEPDGTIF